MTRVIAPGWIEGGIAVGRMLLAAQLREQPLRLFATAFAIALGVALGVSVYLINSAALREFGVATQRLVGEADLIVRGPHEGFGEAEFVRLARDPTVAVASPVIELAAAIPGRRDPLKLLGLDPFRAASLQPVLMAELAGLVIDLFAPDTVVLSANAARELNLTRGDRLSVTAGPKSRSLLVIGILTDATYAEPLGIMDIASLQSSFGLLGKINRIDLRLRVASDVDAFRTMLRARLPAGVLPVTPSVEVERAATVTRAYRVNLNMLALVALWTGAFLVFSTQSLSVLRRRRAFGLLRALGVSRAELRCALVGEGAVLGASGGCLGVLIGIGLAWLMLRVLSGDLGNGQLHASSLMPWVRILPLAGFASIGIAIAVLGAWWPAQRAAAQPPARALKGGDDPGAAGTRRGRASLIGAALLAGGALLAHLPPVQGLPLFGYLSIAVLLLGAVLLVPSLTARGLKLAPRTGEVSIDLAVAQLKDNVGLSALSLAAIIVSFSLMVAMAIMVHSFRSSFESWLGKLLPADIQVRLPLGNDTARWSASDQRALAAVAGISHVEFRRTRALLLDASRPPVTLIARGSDDAEVIAALPLTIRSRHEDAQRPSAWISEAVQDLYGWHVDQTIDIPLDGRAVRFHIAGVWRDYARAAGAIVVTRGDYQRLTGDGNASEASIWLRPESNPTVVEAALRAGTPNADAMEMLTSSELRARSLRLFDRAFAITYALEVIAVAIGLAGVSFAASSTVLARRAEFGMLRHVGLRRAQVIGMLASEGVLTSTFGVMYGLLLGGGLSLILVYVVNRQSFNWSIDLAIPTVQLAVLSVALIAAAALTALWSGRAATGQDALRAVREDW